MTTLYFNRDENFLIWINEEDHLRFISMDKGSDVAKTYNRLAIGVKEITRSMSCLWDKHLGWLSYGPANLGSTLRASMLVKLPKMSSQKNFPDICSELNLQVRDFQ